MEKDQIRGMLSLKKKKKKDHVTVCEKERNN